MNIDVVERDDCLTLVVEGELDIATAPSLSEALAAAESSKVAMIVVDLDRVGFIDSSGLHVLVRYATRASQNGRRIRFTKGSRQAQRLFEISGVLDQLPFLQG